MSMTLERAKEIIIAQAERICDLEEENKKSNVWFGCYTEEKKEVDKLKKEIEQLKDYIAENVSREIEPIIGKGVVL